MASPEPDARELDAFRREVEAWFRANRPPDPGFLLPESFLEVGTDAQFAYLRDWQRKVYEAGYLGMAWPREYGGGGHAPQGARRFQPRRGTADETGA